MDEILLHRQLSYGYSRIKQQAAIQEALVRRLRHTQELSTAAANTAIAWDDAGRLLACCGEDCVIRLWNQDKHSWVHTYEPGQTDSITCAAFLPGTGGRLLVSAGPSKDIRMTDLERQAVRPYTSHTSSVKSLLPITDAIFATGGEDGTVCCFDSRDGSGSVSRDHCLLIDQRAQTGEQGSRTSVLSMCQDPLNQQYIATGGSDALVRVYDVRMMQPPGSNTWRSFSSSRRPAWCYCLAPKVLRGQGTEDRNCQVSSVSFDLSGQRLLAGYAGKGIFSFNVKRHACSYEQAMSSQHQQGQQQSLWPLRPPGATGHRAPRSARHRRRAEPSSGPISNSAAAAAPAATTRSRSAGGAAGARVDAESAAGASMQVQQPSSAGVSPAAAAAATTAAAGSGVGAGNSRRRRVIATRSRTRQQAGAAVNSMRQAPLTEFAQQQGQIGQSALRTSQLGSMLDDSSGSRLSGSHLQGQAQRAAAQDGSQQSGSHGEVSSGPDSSDDHNDDDDHAGGNVVQEVVLAAEVHFVGPDGTLLRTARLPLHRATGAAAQALLRNRGTTSSIQAGLSAHRRQQQQTEALQHSGQRQQQSQHVPGSMAGTLDPLQQPQLQPIAVSAAQDVRRNAAQRLTAVADPRQQLQEVQQQLQEMTAQLQAEQARLSELRQALHQSTSLVEDRSVGASGPASAEHTHSIKQHAEEAGMSHGPALASASAAAAEDLSEPQEPPGRQDTDTMTQLQSAFEASTGGFQQLEGMPATALVYARAAAAGDAGDAADGSAGGVRKVRTTRSAQQQHTPAVPSLRAPERTGAAGSAQPLLPVKSARQLRPRRSRSTAQADVPVQAANRLSGDMHGESAAEQLSAPVGQAAAAILHPVFRPPPSSFTANQHASTFSPATGDGRHAAAAAAVATSEEEPPANRRRQRAAVSPNSSPHRALAHEQHTTQLLQQQQQRNESHQDGADDGDDDDGSSPHALGRFIGAMFDSIGQALGAEGAEQDLEFELPLEALFGRRQGSSRSDAAAAPGRSQRQIASRPLQLARQLHAADGDDDAGAAGMLRAALGLPRLSSSAVQQQPQRLHRPRRRHQQRSKAVGHYVFDSSDEQAIAGQIAPSKTGLDVLPDSAAAETEQHQINAGGLGPAVPTQHLPVQQQQQQSSEQRSQPELERCRRSKRKRSDHNDQQPAAASDRSLPAAGSDAAFVAALSGSNRAQDQPGPSTAAFGSSATAAGLNCNRRRHRRIVSEDDNDHQQAAEQNPAALAHASTAAGCLTVTQRPASRNPSAAAGPPGGAPDSSDSDSSMPPLVSDSEAAGSPMHSDGSCQALRYEHDSDQGLQEQPVHQAAAGLNRDDMLGYSSEDPEEDPFDGGYSICYRGHRNVLSSRGSSWLGERGQYVVSGSDDGYLFVWDAATGEVVAAVKGSNRSIKRVQVNPTQLLLATCAPEEKVRLWSPTADMPVEPEAAMRAYRAAASADEEEEQAVPGNILGVLTRMTERFLGTIFRGQMGGAADMDPSNMMARFRG